MRRLLVLVFFALTVSSPVSAGDQVDAATVVSVGDGDTLRVQERGQVITVRLACIDAPEMAQSPWGQEARQRLQALMPIGSAVEVRSKTTDRYGRKVAEVSRGGRNVNQALVASGAAFVYWQYISGCDRQTYSRLETEARMKGLGVWSTPGGITRPWDFRRGRRSSVREQERCQPSTAFKATYLEVEGRHGSRPDPRPPTESGQGSPEPVRTAEVRQRCDTPQVNSMALRESHPVAAVSDMPALIPA